MFNQLDLKKLFKEKVLLDNPDSYPLIYTEVKEREDDLNYIIELKGKVKYHKNNECEALNRGFKNFFIPEPIAKLKKENPKKHKELVIIIREWFKHNNFTVDRYEKLEINDNILTNAFNNHFPIKYEVDKIFVSTGGDKNQFHWYESKTSTSVQIEYQFDYTEFSDKIIDIIKRRDYLITSKTMQNLARYDFLAKKSKKEIAEMIQSNIISGYLKDVFPNFLENYGIDNLKLFWEKHYKLKMEAFYLLSEYIKWNYNLKEKDFDAIFLEKFNLEQCSICHKKSVSNVVFTL